MNEHPQKLAPHDADLVEADAERLYLETADLRRGPATPWAKCPDYVRNVFRKYAANPYLSERRDNG